MKRSVVLHAVVLVLLVLAASAFAIDWNLLLESTRRPRTTDAMLQGDATLLSSRATGYLAAVPVVDNMAVRKGDLLFEVEGSDYRARVDRAAANVAAASASVAEGEAALSLQEAQLDVDSATVEGAAADAERAHLERQRQDKLRHTESFLARDWENAVASEQKQLATVDGDRRALAAARAQIGMLQANLEGDKATLSAQRAALRLAHIDLGYTRVLAPVDGIVTTRLARLGEYISPGRALITVVPVQTVWVVANYREMQLRQVRAGQHAVVTVDALPGVRLTGHVDTIEPRSQALGSTLPPDRATGNFTKVIQRVPVKVALDPRPDLVGALRPGLSAEVRIFTGTSP